jgi:hypothetical protein
MKLGVAPVIISDGWILPRGPDWRAFSITVKEGRLDELESIVASQEGNYKRMGKLAGQCYQDYFADEVYFNYVVDGCSDVARRQVIPEWIYWQMRHPILYLVRARRYTSKSVRRAVARLRRGS